jgi:hypothetical protein
MKNTFTGAVMEFPNRGIHFFLGELMGFRRQLFLREEFRSQTGWNDALNAYMQTQLEHLAQTVKRICYSPSGSDPVAVRDARILEAKDTAKTLAAAFDGKSINSDDLVMPNIPIQREVIFDWSGNHADYPQPTQERLPNDTARAFTAGLDYLAVMATNLDSRTQPSTISAYEAAQLLAAMNELYALTALKGGEKNRSDVPTGLAASVRPTTFNADGKLDPPAVAAPVAK